MRVSTDLAFASALEQARLIRSRAVSPVDLTEAYLARIEGLNPLLGAYLTVAADHALAAAKAAEARVGSDDLSPLHGVCVSVKDLIDTAGIRTTHGVSVWNERVPDTDADR